MSKNQGWPKKQNDSKGQDTQNHMHTLSVSNKKKYCAFLQTAATLNCYMRKPQRCSATSLQGQRLLRGVCITCRTSSDTQQTFTP